MKSPGIWQRHSVLRLKLSILFTGCNKQTVTDTGKSLSGLKLIKQKTGVCGGWNE